MKAVHNRFPLCVGKKNCLQSKLLKRGGDELLVPAAAGSMYCCMSYTTRLLVTRHTYSACVYEWNNTKIPTTSNVDSNIKWKIPLDYELIILKISAEHLCNKNYLTISVK
jgi:hypothetical protein